MDASEQQVLEAALRGDEEAFEMVIRTYSRTLFAVAFAVLHDKGEAEDVVQDALVKAYRSRWRVRNAEKFPAWLASVARHRALDVLRRRRFVPLDDSLNGPLDGHEPASADTGGAPEGADEETRERLQRGLASLPESHRVAITLRYLEGMDHRSIEKTMGVSNGALRGILGRALGTMRKAMKPSTLAAME
jgi:RNA polymerase sigma-70 factor, ECF subfamily